MEIENMSAKGGSAWGGNKIFIIILLILLIASGIIMFVARNQTAQKNISSIPQDQPALNNPPSNSDNISLNQANNDQPDSAVQNTASFQPPLSKASERITKKPFGIHITPSTSPVQPERFQGYHTGADFEIFPEETDIDVPVKAVCSGKLLLKESASGYGGVAVEECELNNNPVTVVYGHLKLASLSFKTGDKINVGDTLGILGKGYSAETDGERKHLHLGFHQGPTVNIKGYVASKSELSGWIDPCLYVCQ